MDAFQNIGIKDYFKRYGFIIGILRGVFTTLPIHIVKDYENKKILYYRKIKKILKRKYNNASTRNPEGLKFKSIDCNNPIWVYWKQGIENAPDVVKACIQSIKDNATNEVIVITDENTADYVLFPTYILEKLSNGKMSAAAFSDLLRFSLLEHFGGTWIDATVYLTGALPNYVTDSEFFAYQDTFGLIENPALISNWLLHCQPNNIVMRETRNMAFAYWQQENYVMDYLFTYILLTIALENHLEVKAKMPYANSDYCHLLFNELGEKFDELKYKHIKEMSTVHKLTYKLKKEAKDDQSNFFNWILQES